MWMNQQHERRHRGISRKMRFDGPHGLWPRQGAGGGVKPPELPSPDAYSRGPGGANNDVEGAAERMAHLPDAPSCPGSQTPEAHGFSRARNSHIRIDQQGKRLNPWKAGQSP